MHIYAFASGGRLSAPAQHPRHTEGAPRPVARVANVTRQNQCDSRGRHLRAGSHGPRSAIDHSAEVSKYKCIISQRCKYSKNFDSFCITKN